MKIYIRTYIVVLSLAAVAWKVVPVEAKYSPDDPTHEARKAKYMAALSAGLDEHIKDCNKTFNTILKAYSPVATDFEGKDANAIYKCLTGSVSDFDPAGHGWKELTIAATGTSRRVDWRGAADKLKNYYPVIAVVDSTTINSHITGTPRQHGHIAFLDARKTFDPANFYKVDGSVQATNYGRNVFVVDSVLDRTGPGQRAFRDAFGGEYRAYVKLFVYSR